MKRLRISVEGKSYEVEVELLDEGPASPAPRSFGGGARVSAPVAAPRPAAKPAPQAPAAAGGSGGITSPLAALVVSIDVAVGDAVEAGQKVVTLEAMKMNTIVSATSAGTVQEINIKPGDAVEEGQSMIILS